MVVGYIAAAIMAAFAGFIAGMIHGSWSSAFGFGLLAGWMSPFVLALAKLAIDAHLMRNIPVGAQPTELPGHGSMSST